MAEYELPTERTLTGPGEDRLIWYQDAVAAPQGPDTPHPSPSSVSLSPVKRASQAHFL